MRLLSDRGVILESLIWLKHHSPFIISTPTLTLVILLSILHIRYLLAWELLFVCLALSYDALRFTSYENSLHSPRFHTYNLLPSGDRHPCSNFIGPDSFLEFWCWGSYIATGQGLKQHATANVPLSLFMASCRWRQCRIIYITLVCLLFCWLTICEKPSA